MLRSNFDVCYQLPQMYDTVHRQHCATQNITGIVAQTLMNVEWQNINVSE